ncbi:MAG: PH domain-containing protein [Candidatus Kerfeldbacteria bacterium]|nr:PH domain-containing protein [Candidatus Kerfeldbacteria bacterium]
MLMGKLLSSPLPGEQAIFVLRQHWYRFFKVVVRYFLVAVIPFAVLWLMGRYYPVLWDKLFNDGLLEIFVKLLGSLYYLGVWVFFWDAWVDHYLDVWVVTNLRIFTYEQRGLFNRETSELRLGRVQDVSAKIRGLAATILDYGTVIIQTAGAEGYFSFDYVSRPHQVAEKIMKLVDEVKRHDGGNVEA